MGRLLTLNVKKLKLSTTQRAKKILRILKRDNFQCTICGKTRTLTIDHTKIKEKLGKKEYYKYNLKDCKTLCRKCHNKKNNRKNKLRKLICIECCNIIQEGFKGQKCPICRGRTKKFFIRNRQIIKSRRKNG